MRVVARAGTEDVAVVYIGETGDGRLVEFVESLEPPIPRHKKWVLIVSTLFGCPVGCRFCDAGKFYTGRLSREEILSQIDYLVTNRYPGRKVPVEKFKIQFARMGEPAFNSDVLDVLEELPDLYDAPGLMPSLSTIAPEGVDGFFERLLGIKRDVYQGRFQLQFSIHTTDPDLRDWLMPVKRWPLGKIASYGESFHRTGDRKITLNFALARGMLLNAEELRRHFSPNTFLIKITPVNPTIQARRNGIHSGVTPDGDNGEVLDSLEREGYEVILSIGELEENHIGSNCGQYLLRHARETERLAGGYTYDVERRP